MVALIIPDRESLDLCHLYQLRYRIRYKDKKQDRASGRSLLLLRWCSVLWLKHSQTSRCQTQSNEMEVAERRDITGKEG